MLAIGLVISHKQVVSFLEIIGVLFKYKGKKNNCTVHEIVEKSFFLKVYQLWWLNSPHVYVCVLVYVYVIF